MICWWFLAAAMGYVGRFETDQALAVVDVQSNIFRYEVTSRGPQGIVGVDVPQHATYEHIVPQGWSIGATGGILAMRAQKPSAAIAPGEAFHFSMRVSSGGAVLGLGDVKLTFADGQTATVPRVWVPVREPRSHIWLVAGTVLALMLVHFVRAGLVRGSRARSLC